MSTLSLQPILRDSEDLDVLDAINYEAFPEYERWTLEAMFATGDSIGTEILGIYEGSTLSGYVFLIANKKAVYISHLAISSACRSKGYGSQTLALLREYYGAHLYLDMEPMDPQAENYDQRLRREAFYHRNGFRTTDLYTTMKGYMFQLLTTNPEDSYEDLRKLLRKLHKALPEFGALIYPDASPRCPEYPGMDDLYLKYHDEEWSRPCHDEHMLYEMFVIELFQAGLSWRTLLHKREHFERAYDNFDLDTVCSYDDAKIEELMQDASIIRSRPKIKASIHNSKIYRDIVNEYGSFDAYLWHFTDNKSVQEDMHVTRNDLSDTVSADLKKMGMKYAGTVTIYSYLQAMGIIVSHSENCFVYHELKEQGLI